MTAIWCKRLSVCLLGAMLWVGHLQGLTIQLGSGGGDFIVPGDTWNFFRGTVPPSTPADAWIQLDFDDSQWESGPSGFGYGDNDDLTVLSDMEGSYLTVYIRKEFQAPSLPAEAAVDLIIDFDDGFVAYLNGAEVARRNMPAGTPNFETQASSHEAGTPETIRLGTAGSLLNTGTNILAIEGHNTSRTSTDFSLEPALRVASDVVRNGEIWIVESATAALSGTVDSADVVSVTIGGTPAAFNSGDRTWQGEALLEPGLNTVLVEALDVDAQVVESGSIQIVFVPAENLITGQLTEDATWSGAYLLDGTVQVAPGVVLTIDPGTMVLMKAGAMLRVRGQLLADGTESEPIRFTHYGEGTRWERLMFVEAADSRLRHCLIEFSDSAGDHKDYYDNDCNVFTPPLPRSYHEALVALASHVDIEACVFQNLPDDSGSGEGDAIAIIADDVEHPGEASAHILDCQFLSIGAGVHTRYSYVLVENCFFTDHHGDNDDVDLYGESIPPSLVRNNLFFPSYDDMINPTRCSAILIGNIVVGGPANDHGVVLRDKSAPVMINNLIVNVNNGGISVQNQCEALLINNTIIGSGRGLRLFDHTGRWGPPYCLFPGSGEATVINCIIWDCPTSFLLTDSPVVDDPGSHVTVIHSNVEGGQASASVSGNSTLTWGDGNINLDPQFVNLAGSDFHLNPGSPCVDGGTNIGGFITVTFTNLSGLVTNFSINIAVTNDYDGRGRPLDGNGDSLARMDIGAYEVLLPTADSNGDGVPDGWYDQFGLNPADPNVSQGNPDQDAHSTGEEWQADTDPTDPNSLLRIDSLTVNPHVTVQFQSSASRWYTLYSATDLAPSAWSNVVGQTDIPGSGGTDVLQDTNAATKTFYRVGVRVP